MRREGEGKRKREERDEGKRKRETISGVWGPHCHLSFFYVGVGRAGLEGVQTAQPSWASPKDGPQKKIYPVVYYPVVYYPAIKGVQTAHDF
jgi:hypothetical protein